MLAKLVNCLPAMSSTANRPRWISRRNPLTVIPPAGKAIRTTSASLKGVSESIPFLGQMAGFSDPNCENSTSRLGDLDLVQETEASALVRFAIAGLNVTENETVMTAALTARQY
jgi:hypothetical protein